MISTYNIKTELFHTINQLIRTNSLYHNSVEAQKLIKQLNISPIYPIILVGGTNGKGSTCGYLTNILKNSGYKVGTFTSPHVFEYNERICINNIPIKDEDFLTQIQTVTKASKYPLGLFATLTLASHLYFIHQKIDIAIFEVGIGGKNDVTNLFEPTISAITGVDLDHCNLLGSTIPEIALEKAHIYRPNKWAFYGNSNVPTSLTKFAKQINTKLEVLNTHFGVTINPLSFDVWCNNHTFYTLPYPSLRGDEQIYNVALSLAILSKLADKFPTSLSAIKSALIQTKLIGRFQVMPGYPQVIFDVAHNPQAVNSMLKNMVKLPFANQKVAVFGIAKDKDFSQIIRLACKNFNTWHIAPINSERSATIEQIRNALIQHGISQDNLIMHDSITLAIKHAIKHAHNNDRIVCFGSFLVVEEAYKQYQKDVNTHAT